MSATEDPAQTIMRLLQTKLQVLLDYGSVLAEDKIHSELPNEGVDGDFRVFAEYRVDGRTQTLQATFQLGKEKPMLADYVYALRSKTDHLSRHKTA